MAYIKGTATFTNGSTTATSVSPSISNPGKIVDGTSCFAMTTANGLVIVELVTGSTSTTLKLRSAWPYATETISFTVTFTSESIENAVISLLGARDLLQTTYNTIGTVSATADPSTTAKRDASGRLEAVAGVSGNDVLTWQNLTTGPSDTTGALRAEDAYDNSSINYHTGNLNVNEFGGLASNDFIAVGIAASATSGRFFLPINGVSAPTSITVVSTFNAISGAAATRGSGFTVSLNSVDSSNKLAVLFVSGLSGATAGEPVILRTDTATSKITVNFQ